MTIDERIQALTESLELLSGIVQENAHHIDELRKTAAQDGENIRALARIADMHDRRLTRLEGGERQ